ncbi:WD40/YVTN/BNR-like repeat-containing protein [Dictyobacter kobayashii]|uniref:Photosynthesis system II assembly factor Ycf48/Hcf136-like domain-containing protein n=1 Tax=Dictyobacter kobayashii TaxID=2014872 RepID=A0A402ANZ9_9CHLR|nr:hypothetical protein [Dictyobacter kobayashii]GCE20755.1 hypothetical protein KDK_45550 [Dictyobacter kobayashii]
MDQDTRGHTSDGGTSWQDVTPAQASGTILGGYVFNGLQLLIASADPNSTAPATISRTTDGGYTWQNSAFPAQHLLPDPRRMSFINDHEGWAEVPFQGATGNDLVAIFHTTDEGQSWQPISQTPLGPALPVPRTFPFAHHKSGLTFVNNSTGWATVFTDGILQLYATHDGGATWQGKTLSLPVPDVGSSMLPPTFFNSNSGILPIDLQASTGSGKMFLLSHDNGATWQATTPVSAYGGPATFTDMAHIWVADPQGTTLYSSNDGAQHWKKINPTIPTSITSFTQLNFISPTTGWAIGQTGDGANPQTILLKTTNGGQTWASA